MPNSNCLILIGFKSSGKTTVGRLLAKELGHDFIDTDLTLCQLHQMANIGELYQNLGETQFRKLEQEVLHTINLDVSQVIATGGGIILNEETCQFLKKIGTMIYLDTSLESIKKRLASFTNITLFQHQDMDTMYYTRQALYHRHAKLIIKTDNKTPEQLVVEIKQHLGL